jgi:hypothetical protein
MEHRPGRQGLIPETASPILARSVPIVFHGAPMMPVGVREVDGWYTGPGHGLTLSPGKEWVNEGKGRR